jgi:REP element-mobilizing transposase RayT
MIQGIEKKFIFKKWCYKEKYKELLLKRAKLYDVTIIAYCIMDNHVHLLIHVRDLMNMTRFMSSTNTSYGKHFNKMQKRVGYVFRDRYKCENIFTQNHLINCIRYIHENPVKAKICDKPEHYKYSSFNDFLNNCGVVNKEMLEICGMNDENYLNVVSKVAEFDKYIDEESNMERIEEVLEEIAKVKGISLENFSEKDLAETAKEVLSRCNATKYEVANILKIERTRLRRIMGKCPN